MITTFLWVPLLTWAIAQLIKFLIAYIKGDFDLHYLFASGGMPSVHSAVVSSLVVVALVEGGISSPLFGVTGVIAAIVMYDSFGVRRSAGEQANTLNHLITDLGEHGSLRNPARYNELKVILGHKPLEVFVGSILGVIMGLLAEAGRFNPELGFLTAEPAQVWAKVLAVAAVIILAASLSFGWWVRFISKSRKRWQTLSRRLAVSGIIVAIASTIVVMGMWERIEVIDNWTVLIVLVLASLAWYVYLFATTGYRAWKFGKVTKADERRRKWLRKFRHSK